MRVPPNRDPVDAHGHDQVVDPTRSTRRCLFSHAPGSIVVGTVTVFLLKWLLWNFFLRLTR